MGLMKAKIYPDFIMYLLQDYWLPKKLRNQISSYQSPLCRCSDIFGRGVGGQGDFVSREYICYML